MRQRGDMSGCAGLSNGYDISIDMKATGLNIKDIMKERGISVRQLSEIMGISNQSIYRWLSGKAVCSIDNLIVLSDLLNVPIDNIIIRTYSRKPC